MAGRLGGVGAAAVVSGDLAEVAADAGRPLRAAEFAVAAGLATDKAKVGGLRSKLKRLCGKDGRPGPAVLPRRH